jgi:plasmid stabilization system protein ParE
MIIRYSPRATRDLESIREYLARYTPKGTVSVFTAIYAAIEFVRRHPEAAEVTRIPGVRAKIFSATVSRFSIAYLRPKIPSKLSTSGTHPAVRG